MRVLYLEEILASLEEQDPNHLLLSVFVPLICNDKAELRRVAGAHYRRLMAAEVDEVGKAGLVEAFESWLMARFKNRAEVQKMIVDIPPIEKSAAARYFRQQGKEIGEKRGRAIGEKRGKAIGEMAAIRKQISRLKKHRKEIPTQVFQEWLTSLENRLSQLKEQG